MGVFKLVIAFVYLVAPKRAVWFIGRRTRISLRLLLLGHLSFLDCGRLFNFFLGLGFFAATFGFVADFVPDCFLTAGFLDVSFLDDGLFVVEFFLEEVSFLAAGFFVEAFVVAAGFFGLATGFLLGVAGFLVGFFCSFGSLNDPEAPTPFVWTKVPLAVPFFRAVLM